MAEKSKDEKRTGKVFVTHSTNKEPLSVIDNEFLENNSKRPTTQ